MSPRGLTVTTNVRRPLSSAEQANLTALAPEFTLELPQPGRVELVVTDRFERVAGEYDVRALHRSNEAMTAANYAADRPDGALAVGKTVELPDGQVVVVVSTILLGEHSLARHTMLHEAQHVRLIQHGDGAHAVHRRRSFTLTDEFTWEFLWIAESAVDEFRCERAMYERAIPDRDSGSVVSEYMPIRALFDQAWRNLARTDDLLAAYRATFEALDRLAMYLAYGAAKLAVEPRAVPGWDTVPAMGRLLEVVRNVPSPDERMPGDQVLGIAIALARELRGIYQEMGFDYFRTSDGGTYLDVLR
jgi:hypothetical protein